MKRILVVLKGHKRAVALVIFAILGAVQAHTGQDLQGVASVVLGLFGMDGAIDPGTASTGGMVGLIVFAVWSLISYGIDIVRQWRAGAPLPDLGSVEGFLRQAIAEGRVKVTRDGRVVLASQGSAWIGR